MTTYTTNDFSEIVFGRKSVRVYDETHKISHEEMLTMIQEATTAPSSVNMQPWRFVVVIFGDLNCHERGEEIYNQAYASGKMPKEVRDQQLAAIIPHYESLSREQMNDIVKIDASLAAMQFMLVARAHGYETNPIGGFEAEKLAETFGLDQERYVPVMILSVGKGMETGYESVRLAPEKITTITKSNYFFSSYA